MKSTVLNALILSVSIPIEVEIVGTSVSGTKTEYLGTSKLGFSQFISC